MGNLPIRIVIAFICLILLSGIGSAASDGPFSDVPSDHPAADSIIWLLDNDWIEGYPDGTFKGDRNFTRYEFTMIAARVLDRLVEELEELDIDITVEQWEQPSTFDDVQTDHWMCNPGFYQLADQGLLSLRYDDGNFHGDEKTTRGDVAFFFGTLWTRVAEAYDGQGIEIRLHQGDNSFLMNPDVYAWDEMILLDQEEVLSLDPESLDGKEVYITRYDLSICMANFFQRVLEAPQAASEAG